MSDTENDRVGVLHIDIEGGFGGSSRSLYELVSRLDARKVRPVVIHRLKGPVTGWYAAAGIAHIHLPVLPQFVPRKRNSWKIFLVKIPQFLSLVRTCRDVRRIIEAHRISAVHLNYEGLWLLAPFLRRDPDLKLVAHCRTVLPRNAWARLLVRTLEKYAQHVFFISPNERDAFFAHCRGEIPHSVLWNITRPVDVAAPAARWRSRRIVVLSNIDFQKGIDRCLDLAEALMGEGLDDFRIEIFGMARSSPAYFDHLTAEIRRRSLGRVVKLMGFTETPERALESAFCLVRPSRDDDPWGRDVIEAVSAGVPVLATGRFEGVVLQQRTGFLFDPFDAQSMAKTIGRLARDHDLYLKVSRSGRALGRMRFSGRAQVAEFHGVLHRLAADGRARQSGSKAPL